MSDNVSHEFERIENTELVELLGKIRENNSEDNNTTTIFILY